jgi:hypothetical protein
MPSNRLSDKQGSSARQAEPVPVSGVREALSAFDRDLKSASSAIGRRVVDIEERESGDDQGVSDPARGVVTDGSKSSATAS